jgi:hypothetical protein
MGWPKGRKHTSEEKLQVSQAMVGNTPWNKGLVKETNSSVARISQSLLGKQHTKEHNENISLGNKGQVPNRLGIPHNDSTKNRIRETAIISWQDPVLRKHSSDLMIKHWKEPGFGKKMLHRRTPSIPEQTFIDQYNEFCFVGNGELMIDGKNPDFVCTTDEHKLVEIWGEYFKKGRNPQDLIDFYKVRGYECLVIWASELRHLEEIALKIKKFIEVS